MTDQEKTVLQDEENSVQSPHDQRPSLRITVSGAEKSGKTALLSIIKTCLERDFIFRTSFADCAIELVEKTEDIPKKE